MNVALMQSLIEYLQRQIKLQADDTLLRDIVRDSRVPVTAQSGRLPTVSVANAVPVGAGVSLDVASRGAAPDVGNGWVQPPAVDDWKPPGQRYIDAMLDAEDAKWRAQRRREFGQ